MAWKGMCAAKGGQTKQIKQCQQMRQRNYVEIAKTMMLWRCRMSKGRGEPLALNNMFFCNHVVLGEAEEMSDTSTILQDKLVGCSLSCLWDNGLLMPSTDTELTEIKFSYSEHATDISILVPIGSIE